MSSRTWLHRPVQWPTSAVDLARTRWTDWVASAEEGANALRRETGGPIAVAGMSMGGLLALHLAARRPADVAALVLCGTPIRARIVANID